jgi:hypothetical protein
VAIDWHLDRRSFKREGRRFRPILKFLKKETRRAAIRGGRAIVSMGCGDPHDSSSKQLRNEIVSTYVPEANGVSGQERSRDADNSSVTLIDTNDDDRSTVVYVLCFADTAGAAESKLWDQPRRGSVVVGVLGQPGAQQRARASCY